jgi:NAD-dependent DNA ligase
MMLNDNVALATVTDVNWNISKWGKIIPRVFIEPVELSGVTVSKATAFNAKYIEDNRIGQGTVIEITRSGEVIPFILRVVKKSEKPDMPIIPYIWDNTHVHIIAEKCEGTVCIKLAASFFNKMGIKQVGEKRVAKMYDAGFNNVLLMIGASEDDLVKKGKFGKKTANIIVTNICYGLQSITIPDAIGSSGILGYGMGRKRVNALFEGFPDILTAYKSMSIDEIAERVAKIDGFSNKISRVVAVNIKFASSFIGKLSEYATFRDRDVKIMNNTLTGKKYLLTGFRDSTLFADIEAQGATIASSLSGNVTGVIIKEGGGKTGKPVKARSMGIPVYTIYEFRSQVLNN